MFNENVSKLFLQAQRLRTDIEQLREELKTKTVEAETGNGAIKVVVNGHMEVQEIKIAPGILQPENAERLQVLLLEGVNIGLERARLMAKDEMAKLTSGLNLPDLSSLF